ncbi:hypothetical protein [Erythrobacter sp. CCH5-A1]|uniref:hypothetical protein n=1 Tax=Erythrobacter sp. CCH5-A1 TaxID=1768792 RepID=UPI000835D854|nr:hypothetical protein [Erythrobacter sp. CCH5-A1]
MNNDYARALGIGLLLAAIPPIAAILASSFGFESTKAAEEVVLASALFFVMGSLMKLKTRLLG